MELVVVALAVGEGVGVGVGVADDMCVACVQALPIVDRIYSGPLGYLRSEHRRLRLSANTPNVRRLIRFRTAFVIGWQREVHHDCCQAQGKARQCSRSPCTPTAEAQQFADHGQAS